MQPLTSLKQPPKARSTSHWDCQWNINLKVSILTLTFCIQLQFFVLAACETSAKCPATLIAAIIEQCTSWLSVVILSIDQPMFHGAVGSFTPWNSIRMDIAMEEGCLEDHHLQLHLHAVFYATVSVTGRVHLTLLIFHITSAIKKRHLWGFTQLILTVSSLSVDFY